MSEAGVSTDRIEPPRLLPRAPDGLVPLLPDPRGALPAVTGFGLSRAVGRALEARRLIVLLPFAMIGGLVANLVLPIAPEAWALAAGGAAIVVALLIALRSLVAIRLFTLALAFWIGFSLLAIHGALFGTTMLARPAYGTYRATVDEVLSETGAERRVVVSAIIPMAGARPLPVRRARILIRGGPDLAPGDVIEGPIRFAPVPGPVFPGSFDTQFHSYFDGIGAYGNSTKPPRIVTAGAETAPQRVIDAVRTGIARRIDAALTEPAAGVARAIINGDQSAVTDEVRTTMATAGIAHVLSVSGLHLTIVAGGVFAALRMLLAGIGAVAARVSVKRVAAAGGIAAAVLYYGISGGNVAALRSTIMIVLVFGAVVVGRRAITMRNVALAALLVIVVDPASVFRPSFQLSFAAVAALVGAYESLRSPQGRDRGLLGKAWAYFSGITITSLVAGAATLVFSVYHFQQTSPLGVVGNLATLPLVGFIMMPAAAIAVLVMPLGLERPFLWAMGWSIDRMLDVAALVAGWSEHLRATPLLTPTALVLGLLALGWFSFFTGRWRLAGPALLLPAILLLALDHPPDALIADTTQAVAVRTADGLALADGKPSSFAVTIWRDTYSEPLQPMAGEGCDAEACIGTSSAGFTFAIIDDPDAFAEECGVTDLIVARRPPPSYCTAKALIGPDDLARHGVQWLRWDAATHTFEVRPAIGSLDRPWRVAPL